MTAAGSAGREKRDGGTARLQSAAMKPTRRAVTALVLATLSLPAAARAASAIGFIGQMIDYCKTNSPLPEPIARL